MVEEEGLLPGAGASSLVGGSPDRSDGDGDEREAKQTRAPPLWLCVAVYIATALMQPTLTDEIRYSGGAGHVGWPPTLLATLANTLAMSSLLALVPGGGASGLRRAFSEDAPRVLVCTALDFASGCLLTTGLLTVGGAIFVVVYR